MMSFVARYLADNWERLGLQRWGDPSGLAWLVLTPRFRASSNVVFLLFSRPAREPILVAKVGRLPGAMPGLAGEADNLRAVQASRPGGFESIPSALALEVWRGHTVLLETALTGQPINPRLVRADWAACCQGVVDWLVELAQATGAPADQAAGGVEQLVERPLQQLAQSLPATADDVRLLEQTRQLARPLRDVPVPLVCEHGDLSHPNLVLSRTGRVGVVDWEAAQLRGLPGRDLFFFLTYAAAARGRAASEAALIAAVRSAFYGPAAWARAYLRDYAQRVKLPLSLLPTLFVLTWPRYLAGLLTRLKAGGSGQVSPETAAWLRSHRYYRLWAHVLAHPLELR